MSHPPRRTAAGILLLIIATTSGCSTIGTDLGSLLMIGPTGPELPQQVPPGVPTATVVMVASGREPVSAELPLHDTTYVQSALETTGLKDRFGRMSIELFRPLEAGNHRLEIRFDRAERRVPPSFDYALRPGDRLVVTEDTSTVFDDMLESLNVFE